MHMTPTDRQVREISLRNTNVRIASYRLGEQFVCAIDNISPGATIARGHGPNRESAEAEAIAKAMKNLP